jgi:mono/diheme cytochrome c family protein
MRRNGIVLLFALAVLVWMPRPVAAAEFGDAGRGAETAGRLCSNCHALPGDGQASAADTAPPFIALAERADITEESLRVTLSAPHGPMPTEVLSRQDRADVIAFILSLRKT